MPKGLREGSAILDVDMRRWAAFFLVFPCLLSFDLDMPKDCEQKLGVYGCVLLGLFIAVAHSPCRPSIWAIQRR